MSNAESSRAAADTKWQEEREGKEAEWRELAKGVGLTQNPSELRKEFENGVPFTYEQVDVALRCPSMEVPQAIFMSRILDQNQLAYTINRFQDSREALRKKGFSEGFPTQEDILSAQRKLGNLDMIIKTAVVTAEYQKRLSFTT